jgi:hypothetical protein
MSVRADPANQLRSVTGRSHDVDSALLENVDDPLSEDRLILPDDHADYPRGTHHQEATWGQPQVASAELLLQSPDGPIASRPPRS